jgi:hypothetical protein
MTKPALVPFLAGLVVAVPGSAQGVQTLDQGSFTITLNGERVGREDFSIVATPGASGMEYVARATVVFGDRRLTPALKSDSAGTPAEYQVEIKGTTSGSERWSGKITRGRVSARINSARGESAREYIVTDGAIILDDDVFHQYFFVARRSNASTIPIVIPRRNTQMVLRVSTSGNEKTAIGGKELDAKHLVLTEQSGATRDVWVDAQGRVLRVEIKSRNVTAVRDDPPPG